MGEPMSVMNQRPEKELFEEVALLKTSICLFFAFQLHLFPQPANAPHLRYAICRLNGISCVEFIADV